MLSESEPYMNEETQRAIAELELRTLDRFERYLKLVELFRVCIMWLLILCAAITILTTIYCVASISDLRERITKIESTKD